MAEIFTEKSRRLLLEGKPQTAEIQRRNGSTPVVQVIPIRGRHTGRIVRFNVRIVQK